MPGPARAGALIYARDPGLLSHFYRTLLQMEIRSQSDELIVQENADIQLLLHAIPAPYAEQVVITTPPQLREQAERLSQLVSQFRLSHSALLA